MQVGPERCIFFSSNTQIFQEISTFPMGGEFVRIPMSVFRTRSSSFDFHKNNENTHCFASPIKHSNYNLSRRHVNSGSVYSGSNSASRHSDLPPATIRLYNQLQKVNFLSSSENRISEINNRFLKNGIDIRSRKNIQDNLSMSGYVQFSEHDSNGPNTSNREVRVNCSGSSTSETSSASFAKTTNQSVQGNQILPNKNCFGHSQAELLWWIRNLSLFNGRTLLLPPADMYMTTDASQTGWGASCQGQSTGGPWSREEQKLHINVLELKSIKLALLTFTKFRKINHLHLQIDNMTALSYLLKMGGGDSQHATTSLSQRDLGLSFVSADHDYCRVYSQSSECNSRQGIQRTSGLERVEVITSDISESMSSSGYSRYRSVCLPHITSSSRLYGMETRFGEHCNRRFITKLVQSLPLCIPTILSNWESPCKAKERESKAIVGNSNMANTNMVFYVDRNVSSQSHPVTTKFAFRPKAKCPSTGRKQNITISGLGGFRDRLATEGISDRASKLITNSRREGSISSYESAWRKWSS